MLTEMDGNPPIYITKRRTPQGEEVYVNNAMVLKSRSNVDLKNEHGKRQVSSSWRHWLIDHNFHRMENGINFKHEFLMKEKINNFLRALNEFDLCWASLSKKKKSSIVFFSHTKPLWMMMKFNKVKWINCMLNEPNRSWIYAVKFMKISTDSSRYWWRLSSTINW